VQRITLNRPEKRNAMNNALRTELFCALEAADGHPDLRVSIIRGAGACLRPRDTTCRPTTPGISPGIPRAGLGQWSRHVVDGWFHIWDLAKPVIAQAPWLPACAGGTELATACDLVYVAEDAQIGYPPVRLMSPPDMQFHPWLMGMRQAMESMLTGDALQAAEARAAGLGQPRMAGGPARGRGAGGGRARGRAALGHLAAINKRSVHRAMEIAGLRAAIRAAPTCRRWRSRPSRQQGLHVALPPGRRVGVADC
jgi:enoyl-CoA hydratase